ncbi:Lipocalin/cytosolic fatty-acid binding domain [Trinorchestia longiramus]|nr:Lipocalin/cytosolic fatty-acid binding domain [Trinorchestia longiramus]
MDLRSTTIITALLCSLAKTSAEIGLFGCPSQAVIGNVDITQYAGTWYVYSMYERRKQSEYDCPQEKYTPTSNGLVKVEHQYKRNNVFISKIGQMKFADPSSTEGKLSLYFTEGAYEDQVNDATKVNYQILATDYTGYSIVWDCTSLFFLHFTRLRILTRERSPPQAMIDNVQSQLRDRNIKVSLLRKNNHDDC